MNMKKSMIEHAYTILKQQDGSMPFLELWKLVSKEMNYTESQMDDNIAQFYTDLSLDGHFVNLPKNYWDLKTRHTYSESVMDTDSIAVDEDDEDNEDSESDEKDILDEEDN